MPEIAVIPLQESALSRANPFPGLRAYGEEDATWFFGRSREINDLLKRLRRLHFVAIVGASGTGKSSVVRAGVLPQLRDGYLDAEWKIAQFRPGERPLANLAEALGTAIGTDPAELGQMLRRGPGGVIRGVQAAWLPGDAKLLILVDQFEELFQFAQRAGDAAQEEVKEFLKLLLTAASADEVPVYVMVTMRLEWLSECASYTGLSEAINEGLYLVPQMRRQQFQQAILGPLESAEGSLTSALLDRMLNDLDNKSDQLPVLQHALLRLWAREGATEPFDTAGYEAVGTFSHCLSAHAEEVYAELSDHEKQVAELLFRSITQVNKGRKMRRPRPVSDILPATRSTFEELEGVILAFSKPGRSFLVTTQGALTPTSIVDLSHEALIRQWTRLSGWVEHEAEVESRLERLRDDAADWDRNRKGSKDCLYTGSRLVRAAELQPMLTPESTEASFLKESIRARSALQFRKWGTAILAALVIFTALGFYLYDRARSARAAEVAKLKQSQLETALATAQAKKAQEFQQNLVERIDAAKGDQTALAAIAQSIQAQRVYLQYAPGGAATAGTVQALLKTRSYAVPGIEQVSPDKSPKQTQVRYFHDPDRGEALKIAGLLKPLVGNVDVQRTANPKDVVPAGQFEVWVGPAQTTAQAAPETASQQVFGTAAPPVKTPEPVETKAPPASAVIAGPVINASVRPDHVVSGHSTVLTWQTENTRELELEGVGTVAGSGTMQVTPQQSTTYKFIAKGEGGTVSTTLSVEVLPAPAAANPEPAAVKAALTRYRDAYESESMDEMLKVWPTMPKARQKDLKAAFSMFNAIHLSLDCNDQEIHVRDDEASARCAQTAIYTREGKRQPEQTGWAFFILHKSGGGWVVSAVQ